MNRFHLRFSYAPILAILLFLAFSASVFGQVTYTINGTFQLVSGMDLPIPLNNTPVTAVATISQTAPPTSSSSTSTSSTNAYSNVSVNLTLTFGSAPCASTVTLTNNAGAAGQIGINCTVIDDSLVATAIIPAGDMVTAVPAQLGTGGNINITATVSVTGPKGNSTVYNLTGATISAAGTLAPAVTPSPTSVSLGGANPLSKQVTLTPAVTGAVVSYTTSTTVTTPSGGTWLSVTPTPAGNTTSGLTITATPGTLSPGTYNGTVTLSYGSSGLAATSIPVTLTVPLTTLTGPSTGLTFGYTTGGTPPANQTLNIGTASGTVTANAAVTSGNSWLSVTPSSATASSVTPAAFTVSVNTTGLTANTYNGNIQVTSAGASNTLNIPVTLNVSSNTLTVPTNTLAFSYTIGGTAPLAKNVNITGTSGITYSTSVAVTTPAGGTWLVATPSGTTVPGSVSVSVNTTGLAPGNYSGTVTVSSTGAAGSPANIPVTLAVTGPTLTATPSMLSFNYQIGAGAPASQSIAVGGTPNTNFNVAANTTGGGSWLTINGSSSGTTPSSGTVPVSISVNPAVLTTAGAGTYQGTVTISATGATSQVVNVTATVTQPTLTLSTNALNFAFQIGGTAPAAQSVGLSGTTGLSYTATPSGGSWLLVNGSTSAASGTIGASSSISVSVNITGLAANTYNGVVTIAAPGVVSQTVNVTLVVSASPTISASPSSLTFNYQIGTSAPAAQTITIGGSSGLSFTSTIATTSGGSWLSVGSTGTGTVPGVISVSLITSALTTAGPGTYHGTITVAAPGATSQVVSVKVVVSNSPAITAAPASVSFAYTIGGTAPAAQAVTITGGSGIAFTAAVGPGSSWLSVSPGAGDTPGSINVSVNTANLTAATYNGSIIITAGGASNSPLSIPVSLVITVSTSTITLSANTLNFAGNAGGTIPAAQTVNVTASPSAVPVTVALDGGTWLTASLSKATTPSVLTITANQANLPAGSYAGTVIINSTVATNSPQTVLVQFTVSPQTNIAATPTSLTFAYMLGSGSGSAPDPQTVNVTTAQPVPISVSAEGASWLYVTTSDTNTPASVTVSVDPTGLPNGTYQATISLSSSSPGVLNSPVVPVTLIVSDQPMLAPSPMSLTFAAETGASNPASQSINLSGSAQLPFTVVSTPAWLSVSAGSGTTPSTLMASVNIAGLSAGSYQGAITITADGAPNSPMTIPVTLNLAVPLAVTGGPTIASIINAASYDLTGFSPGAIVSLFGSQLGPQTGESFSLNSGAALATTLAGVTVTVEGEPAIPLYVQNGQINVILPFNLGTSGQANVQVAYQGLTSAQFNIPLMPADVQIFTANSKGTGPGSILNQDFSVNTASNPAAAGSVIAIYGTGGGAVNPPVTAGAIAGNTLSWVALPFSATVNGEPAMVLYAGTAPGLVYGVYQFNVQLPADLPSGAQTIVLQVGSSTSQANVTVFVK
jgi:uncharacterized protein (TIGR03437 family)